MVDITKPVYGTVWAETGEKLSPIEAKLQSGWVQEMMPYQYENFLQNRQDVAITYLFQKGVPEWSSEQEYIANKSVVTYFGNIYAASTTNTNTLPTDTTSWRRLSVTFESNGAIPISMGGTGATSASVVRTNLGLGTIATATAPITNGFVVRTAADTLVSRSITGTSNNIVVTNGDGVAGNININTGSNVALLNTDSSWTSTGSIRLPSGSTSQQGASTPGRVRFNLETDEFHGAYSDGWKVLAKPASAEQTPITDAGNFYTSPNVEGALQEVGLKASFVKDVILSYPDYAAASAAAATLPDGQVVEAPNENGDISRYIVIGGILQLTDYMSAEKLLSFLRGVNGVDNIGGAVKPVLAISDAREYTGLNDVFVLEAGKVGIFTLDQDDATSLDDGVFVIVSSDGKRRKRVIDGMVQASWWGLPKSGNCYAELVKIEQHQFTSGDSVYFANGLYEVIGSLNFPWRNTSTATFRDYKGAKIVCEGPGVVFKTTSPDGGDVFQLNCVANLSIIGYPTLTADITTTGAGSNGVSVTNGGNNIYAEVEALNLPHTVKADYLDGGKAVTIQTGALTTLPTENVHLICRKAINCAYGFEMSINETRLAQGAYMAGNKVELYADNCYRGVAIAGDLPTVSIPSNGLDFGIEIKATLKDCQQYYSTQRDWRVKADIHVIQTQAPSAWTPNDTLRRVMSSLASRYTDLKISGTIQSTEVLYEIGGSGFNIGQTGIIGRSESSVYNLSVSYQAAATPFRVVDSGGNSVTNCVAHVIGVPFGSAFTQFLAANNSLRLGQAAYERDLSTIGTFSVNNTSGVKRFGVRADGNFQTPMTTYSAIGGYRGKIAVYDPSTDALLGYFPLYD